MIRAIDFANFSPVPTPEQVRCWLDAGYTKAIIGTSFGTVADAQIAACEAGGMDVETYCFPTRIRPHRPYWLDCETPEATVTVIKAICESVTLAPIGIYTRRGWWTSETGDWDIKSAYPFLKLWDAAYADPPQPFVPYGGFSERAMHQWHDSTLLCGINVDLNIVEEEHMPTPEYVELTAKHATDIKDIETVLAMRESMTQHDRDIKDVETVIKLLADRVSALEAKEAT